jgi:superfamily I DNA/RNA helicase
LFASVSDDRLLGYGVPAEWLGDVRGATEDTVLLLADRLPAEAAEALLELATGGEPRTHQPTGALTSPFEHPDAQRRFRTMANVDELRQALEYPWEKWTVFLHPEQRQLVERSYVGPARVSGSAGTGKTIVAVHRAVYLARTNPNARVLLTTFSDTLASALHTKLRRLIGDEPRLAERVDVFSLDAIGLRLYKSLIGPVQLASGDTIRSLIGEASSSAAPHKFGLHFLVTEWEQIVDAWQVEDWESYRDVGRLGRKTRLAEAQRALLWTIFDQVKIRLKEQRLTTWAGLFVDLATAIMRLKHPPFDVTVVDESQDVSPSQLRFLGALGGGRPDALFFAGDLGQRIFQQPFSWKSVGVDIRGRSRNLRVNYRTSHQIRMQADRLLGREVADVDGNTEDRRGTVSVFNGQLPTISQSVNEAEEIDGVASWLAGLRKEGLQPHEFGIVVRTTDLMSRAIAAVTKADLPFTILDDHVEIIHGHAAVCTMHLAKGLEFRAVAVMACDDEVVPLQSRIESVGDDADLQEVYDTERHLLYVACTRARDHLSITGVRPTSEFLDDLREVATAAHPRPPSALRTR